MYGMNTMIIYHNWLPLFEMLSPEDAKRLIVALMRFSISGDYEPIEDSETLNSILLFMCDQVMKDVRKYQRRCGQSDDE